jgi:hypothetical protein
VNTIIKFFWTKPEDLDTFQKLSVWSIISGFIATLAVYAGIALAYIAGMGSAFNPSMIELLAMIIGTWVLASAIFFVGVLSIGD